MSSSSRVAGRVLRGDAGRRVTELLDLKPPELAVPARGLVSDPFAAERAAGYQNGYDTAMAEVETRHEAAKAAQAEQLSHALAAAAAEAHGWREAAVAQAGREAIELAFELVEVLLGREITLKGSLSTESLARALALVPQGEDLVIRLHPDDALSADDVKELVKGASVTVVADPQVEMEGCVVEAGPSRIDAQLGPAIARARALIESVDNHKAPCP